MFGERGKIKNTKKKIQLQYVFDFAFVHLILSVLCVLRGYKGLNFSGLGAADGQLIDF